MVVADGELAGQVTDACHAQPVAAMHVDEWCCRRARPYPNLVHQLDPGDLAGWEEARCAAGKFFSREGSSFLRFTPK